MAEVSSKLPLWIKALAAMAVLAFLANGIMIAFALGGRRDLVRADYYQAGLEQDARMARRALAAGHGIRLSLQDGAWTVELTAAAGADGDPSGWGCRVRLQRPDDGREDRSAELGWRGVTVEGAAVWQGDGHPLRKGRYDVLIEWEKDGEVFMETAFHRYVDG
jgi:hypothetical protein